MGFLILGLSLPLPNQLKWHQHLPRWGQNLSLDSCLGPAAVVEQTRVQRLILNLHLPAGHCGANQTSSVGFGLLGCGGEVGVREDEEAANPREM